MLYTPGELKLRIQLIAANNQVRSLCLKYSCTLNYSKHTFTQVAKTNDLVGLLHKTVKLNESKPHSFRKHDRPILECCSPVCSNIRQCDKVAIEMFHCAPTKQSIGCYVSINYVERCELLKLDPPCLRRTRANLVLFNNIIM